MPHYALKQSQTARPLLFLMIDSTDHLSGKTGLSPTVTLSKDGAAFASPAGAVTELSNGWYKVAGNATDTDTLGPLILHATGTGADPCDAIFDVVAYDPEDAVSLGLTAVNANVVQLSGDATAADNAEAMFDNTGFAASASTIGTVNSVAAGGITASSIATDAIDADALADGAITAATFAAGAIDAAAIAADAIGASEFSQAAADKVWSSATRSLTDKVGFALSAAGIQAIWDALTSALTTVGSIGKLLVDNVNATISSRASSAEVAAVQADTDDIQTRLPATLVGGRIDSSVGAMAANVLTASALAADAVAEIADGVWDEATSGHTAAGTFGRILQIIRDGTAQAGAAGTITLDAGASGSDDFYNNTIIAIVAGTGAGQARFISDYVGSTKVATVNANWITNPDSTSVFVILPFGSIPGASAPTAAQNAAAVWDEARAGHVTVGSFGEGVASVQGNVTGSVGSVATGGITAASIATDAIDADALAANAVAEIQSGLATAAALATVQADTDDIQTRLPAALVSGRIDASVGAVATGAITATAIAADAIGASELAASAVDKIADQVWDELRSGHAGAGSFGQALQLVRDGTAQAGAAATITLDTGASALDDFYVNTIIFIVGGTGVGQARFISDYVGATKVATIEPNWVTIPDATSVFVVLPFGQVPGATAPTAIQVADAFLDRDMSLGTDSGSATVRTPRQALRFLRNRWNVSSGGTLDVYEEDDATISWSGTVGTDAAAQPIVSNNPAGGS